MTAERPKKLLNTTGGFGVTYKTFITGREFNALQEVYLKSAEIVMVGQTPNIKGLSPMVQFEATKKLIELMVVSVNGVEIGLVDLVLDLPKADYEEVLAALNEASGQGEKKSE